MQSVQSLAEFDRRDLPLAGGKGANLGALLHAGLPVPPGFCVTTAGYQRFVTANDLQPRLLATLNGLDTTQPQALEAAATLIRQWFENGDLPDEIAQSILSAYAALGGAVAVRSSATAEDLPDLSFAGQQDTYLNIHGAEALLQAVKRCWGSLWSARAIGYRARNGISQQEISLAVVVQRMVPSEASGVLFSANPLSGKRDETVIDATLGLGEALVSGMVEPDHYVVDAAHGRILKKTLGAKALSVRGVSGGGTQTVDECAANVQALPDEQILALAALGQQAERFFGGPQDMEWAWAGGQLYVVQSRPVTSLYPLPAGAQARPLEVLFSFGVWQGMLDPFSPLGQDMLTGLAAGVGRCFGSRADLRSQRTFQVAGERLFANVTGLFHQPAGRNILRLFISAIDPASAAAIDGLLDEPELALAKKGLSPAAILRLVRALLPVAGGVLYNLFWPEAGRRRLARRIEALVDEARRRCNQAGSPAALAGVLTAMPAAAPSILLPYLLPAVISGQVPFQRLLMMAETIPNGEQRVMDLTRGLEHNVTTEMDLCLWATAQRIRRDPPSAEYFAHAPAADLVAAYRAGRLPAAAQQALADFLQRYGMRGVGEIDIARPRWKDDPLHILQTLQSYIQIDGQTASPEAIFRSGAERARQAQIELVQAFGKKPVARLVNFLAGRVRHLTGLRETPKFAIVRMLDVLRTAALATGQQLVASGVLEQADDVFFLHTWELQQLGQGDLPDARALVAARRQNHHREMGRRRSPRLLLSDGRTFYESAPAAGDGALSGSPVSAGTVEGTAHVVLDPHRERLQPGEILVCRASDPAWTPLFLAAGGLIMEVGGMMTHGSVVAREYGIPAVVGVNQATTRLHTGQRLRLDGTTGQIFLLD